MESTTKDSISIIAMKGHPFTRKTELAKKIASSLSCPLLSYEHWIPPPLSPDKEKELFRNISWMAFDNLIAGMSVVIDSPLSSAWHLAQLTDLAEIADYFYSRRVRVRVIIIECKPTNAYSWRLKFEEYMNSPGKPLIPWYKPNKWEDVEKAIEINPADYDEKSVHGHEYVSKLVVDPLFLSFSDERIAEVVKYMMTRDEGDGPDVVLFHQWRQLQSSSSSSTDLDCSKDGHNIVSKYTAEEGLSVDCAFCEKQVMMRDYYYYYCKGCSLALHKDCAESSARKTKESTDCFYWLRKYACSFCKGKGEDFSDECGTCIVETHLSIRRVPTVISHVDTEEHLLTDEVLSKKIHEPNHCIVCGLLSRRWSVYLCNICGLTYHYECVTLPRRVNHEHGLHYHHLSLKFTSEEAEDYLCNECNQLRDPSLWFYSCEECPYELHPYCVRQDKVYRSDSSVPDYNFDWENYKEYVTVIA